MGGQRRMFLPIVGAVERDFVFRAAALRRAFAFEAQVDPLAQLDTAPSRTPRLPGPVIDSPPYGVTSPYSHSISGRFDDTPSVQSRPPRNTSAPSHICATPWPPHPTPARASTTARASTPTPRQVYRYVTPPPSSPSPLAPPSRCPTGPRSPGSVSSATRPKASTACGLPASDVAARRRPNRRLESALGQHLPRRHTPEAERHAESVFRSRNTVCGIDTIEGRLT